MITKKLFHTIDEIQQIQRLASVCTEAVGIHSEDGKVIIDAKSYIGMYALDFRKPVCIVTESKEFHDAIRGIGETIPEGEDYEV